MTTTSEDGLEGLKTDTNLTDDLSAAPPLLRFFHVHVRPHGGGPQLHSQCIRPRDHHHRPARSRLAARGELEPGRLLVSSSPIATPHPFEDMTPIVTIPLSLGLWGGFLVAGSTWAIWQRHVALAAAPGEGVRNPDWHAQAWFASIVMWWEPLRNVRELSAYFLSPQRRRLIRHGGSPGSRSGSQGGWSSGSCGCRRLCCSWPRR